MAYLLQHLLTESAARAPRLPAVAAGERFLTYEELDRLSNQVARTLVAQGVAPGDRVAQALHHQHDRPDREDDRGRPHGVVGLGY